MYRSTLGLLALALTVSSFPVGASARPQPPAPGSTEPAPPDLAKIADALAPSMVRVEYTLQYDKGDSPGSNWARAYRTAYDPETGWGGDDWDGLIKQERPLERAGYLLSDSRVITADPLIHPRFIKEIAVRAGDQVIKARPGAYGRNQNALYLDLAEPVHAAKPLVFDAGRPGPYLTVSYHEKEGVWSVSVGASRPNVTVGADARRYASVSSDILLVDKSGVPAGMSMTGTLGLDGSWKGSPEKWPMVAADQMSTLLADLEHQAGAGLLRVALSFRSPRSAGETDPYARYRGRMGGGGEEEQGITEWNGAGILTDDSTVVVLANFKPKVTARLETIRVFGPDGLGTPAKFAGTLTDYGCFLATLDKPLAGAVRFNTAPITEQRDRLLLKPEITVVGEIRTAYFGRDRISAYMVGWRRHIYPVASPTRDAGMRAYYGSGSPVTSLNFLYGLDGALVAVPVAQRQKVAVEDRWSGYSPFGSDSMNMLPAAELAAVLKDRAKNLDAENKPLSEGEENRLAWLGVELQAMTPDLARVNNVVDRTSGGTTGALVTYLYPDSPAAKAGIQMGDILLRMHVQGQPKPLEVTLDSISGYGGFGDEFWSRLDQIPEEYFDQMPKPWGSVENSLTRALTDIGFGTPFTAEVFRDGKVLSLDFKVEQGPPYFDSANHFKSEPAGVTVRDLTYEVRRYFQIKPGEPGVIISKIEKGGKAAVAGLKPYELVLSVNDQPMTAVGDFEKALATGGELRLSIKRMTEGRLVKMKIEPAKPGAEAPPAPKP